METAKSEKRISREFGDLKDLVGPFLTLLTFTAEPRLHLLHWQAAVRVRKSQHARYSLSCELPDGVPFASGAGLDGFVCTLARYFRKPLWGPPPDPQSPKTPAATTKKEIPKTLNSSRIP